MKSNLPLVCDMGVCIPTQRKQHVQSTTQLFQAVQAVHEAEHGFEFIWPNESDIIIGIGQFISNERLCCPFLEFSFKVSNSEPITLTLAGPDGTQEFLHEEFREVFG